MPRSRITGLRLRPRPIKASNKLTQFVDKAQRLVDEARRMKQQLDRLYPYAKVDTGVLYQLDNAIEGVEEVQNGLLGAIEVAGYIISGNEDIY